MAAQDESYAKLGAMESEDTCEEEWGFVVKDLDDPAQQARLQEEAMLPATSSSKPSSLRVPRPRLAGAIAAVATAALLLLAAVVARRGVQGTPVEADAAVNGGSLELFGGIYKDHDGQLVCPAGFNARGKCTCTCDWAANGGCSSRSDDGTCCFSCCCSTSGGGFVQVAQPHQQVLESAGQVTHVHYYHHAFPNVVQYQVGQSVYVKGTNGQMLPAVVTAVLPNGQYSIRYMTDDSPHVVPVAGSDMYHQSPFWPFNGNGPNLWLIMGAIFLVLIGIALFLGFKRK